jgi:glycosyltransferase involved in cell wall biosynthesis
VTRWHIITGEYPPQPGGVSDYTRMVAEGLVAAGDLVTVWAPACAASDAGRDEDPLTVRRLRGGFGAAALRELGAALDREPAPRRLLVQYVPHAFGWKALNVPFCWWLRSRRGDSIWVMFHEVAFPVDRRQGLAQNAMGLVTRRMAAIVAGAAERAFVSIPEWELTLRSLGSSAVSVEWLPVPSAIPVVDDRAAIANVRERLSEGGCPIVGHFGTYGALTLPLVTAALPILLTSTGCSVVLLGRGSEGAAEHFVNTHPDATGRVHGAGALSRREVSIHLSACDVMLQPYPDGISTRRTSAMAGLAHGRALATTDGWLTEAIWRESSAVALSPAGDARALAESAGRLAADRDAARRMGASARALYDARFDIRHTIEVLRGEGEGARVA